MRFDARRACPFTGSAGAHKTDESQAAMELKSNIHAARSARLRQPRYVLWSGGVADI